VHTHRHKPTTPAHPRPTAPASTTQPAVAPAETNHRARSVSADDIRLCAYRKWECAGKPSGDGVRFWLEAEQELIHGT
jgi:hypothetical protein